MRKLVKDLNDNVAELISINGLIPEGWTEVPSEELDAEELALARRNKMAEIRSKRNTMLAKNDTEWLIDKKKGLDVSAIEADAETLRDLPQDVEAYINQETDIEALKAFDAFSGLTLSRSYE